MNDVTRPLLDMCTALYPSACRLQVLVSTSYPTLLLVEVLDRENNTREQTYCRDVFEGTRRLFEVVRERMSRRLLGDAATVIVNHCPCGQSYSQARWIDLRLVGVDEESGLELRNCQCGSTRAIQLMPFTPEVHDSTCNCEAVGP